MRAQAVDEFIKGLEEGCRRGPESHRFEPAMFRSQEWRWPDADCADTAEAHLRDLFPDSDSGPSSLLWVDGQPNGEYAAVIGGLDAIPDGDAGASWWSGAASSRNLRRLTKPGRSQRADAESDGAKPAAR